MSLDPNKLIVRSTVDVKPHIKVNDGTAPKIIDVTVNGQSVVEDRVAKVIVPTKVSELDNDSHYTTEQQLATKQDTLESGENIKTINGNSILGSGNIDFEYCFDNEYITLNEIYSIVGEKPFLYVSELDGRNIGHLIKEEQNIYTVNLFSSTRGIKTINEINGDNDLWNLHSEYGEWIEYITDETLEATLEPWDERIARVEKQILVYDYFYSDTDHSTITLPLKETSYNFLEFSTKGLSDNLQNCYIRIFNGEEPYIIEDDENKPIFSTWDDFNLYQTGYQADMATTRYAYDTIDFNTGLVVRYCYPISFQELFSMFSATDFSWSGSSANGRLSISHSLLASKGIYTENGFAIKSTRDIGLTYRGISTSNFAIDNLKSIQGITNKATAISILSGEDYADVYLIFKRVEPITEDVGISIYIPSIECDGVNPVIINRFDGCIKASYLSLYDLVYSKDQADAKFQTIAEYVEQYTSNDHIKKIGDLEDENRIAATTAIYQTLREAGYPKVASAYCVQPDEVEPGEEFDFSSPLVPFTRDTLFINSFDGTNYGYIVLSNQNIYWFRVDTRTGDLTLKSMLEREITYDEIKDKPRANDNIINSDNDSLTQISHFNTGLTWSSDDESVATVDQEGKITAVGAGSAIISVIDEDGRAAECEVTVTNPSRQINTRKGMLRGAAPSGTSYQLVSNVSSLSDGDAVIFAAARDDNWYTLNTTSNGNNRGAVQISAPVDNIITITESNVEEITLAVVSGQTNQYNFAVTGGYLYAGSSSSNYLKTRASVGDANANWLISISGDEATITSQGSYTHNTLLAYLSGSSKVFSAYLPSSSNTKVRIYKKVEGPITPTGISISGTTGTITEGAFAYLTAAVTPPSASQEVTWTTSDSHIINITNEGHSECSIQAVGQIGESATITAACEADPSITASVIITIVEEPTIITAVNVTPSSVSGLEYGETAQLEAEVIGTGPRMSQAVTWTSGDTAMATVDSEGLVTVGNKPGNAVITATSDVNPNVYGTSIIEVPQAMVESIEIDPSTPTDLTVGLYSEPINYNVSPSYAYDKRVAWSSSDTSKATVENGIVYGVDITDEPVIITVSALDGSGLSDSISINIVEPLGTLYLDVEELTLVVGDTYKLICSDKPFNTVTGRTSAALGSGNDVEHEDSFAFGSHLTSTADNQTLVGKYNDTTSNAAFAVGAGNANTGFNAFEVSASGKAKAGTATESTDGANTLVTKGFADATYVARTRTVSILTSDWSNSAVTLSLSPITVSASDVLLVTPSDDCAQEYYNCGIQRTISQDGSSLTLSCTTLPEETMTIQIVYFKGLGF